jgi:hypothetical protein
MAQQTPSQRCEDTRGGTVDRFDIHMQGDAETCSSMSRGTTRRSCAEART